MKSRLNQLHYFNSPNINSRDILNDPSSSLEDVLMLNNFVSLWIRCDPLLYSFLIDHYDELIEIGFQIKSESRYELRKKCIQIMCSNSQIFRQKLFTETNFLRFVYSYLFNISFYPFYSQKYYFDVLPYIMLDPNDKLQAIFDDLYFIELFKNADNEYIYNFTLKLVCSSPPSIQNFLKNIEPAQIIVNNLAQVNFSETNNFNNRLYLIRNQTLFKRMIGSKIEGNASIFLYEQIDQIIENAIKNRNSSTFSFLRFIDEYSSSKNYFSKWKSIHYKITPYLTSFCELVLQSEPNSFNSLSESCSMLSIKIISTTKIVTDDFIELFKRLSSLFFVMKRNSFLHNCFLHSINLLISLGKINSEFLDDLNLFNKIIHCYENRMDDYNSCYWGQLRLVSESINQFALKSKTVDLTKWNEIVVKKNKISEKIIHKNYGGIVPFNTNNIYESGLKSLFLFGGAVIIIVLICFITIFLANEI